MKLLGAILALTLLIVADSALHAAEEDAAVKNGRNILKKHGNSIAILKSVTNTKREGFGTIFGGAGKDQVSHTPAIFLDDAGMAVVSYSGMKSGSMTSISVNVGGEEEIATPKEEFKKFDYILADGTRVPAQVVITDPKLDLAIIAPEKPLDAETKKKISFVSLDNEKKPEMLDHVVTLSRLSTTLDSQAAVGLQRIWATVDKPRTLFITTTAPGQACFDAEGNFLGLGILIQPDTEGGFGSIMEAEMVVLPAQYIKEVVEQAKAKMAKP